MIRMGLSAASDIPFSYAKQYDFVARMGHK